MVTSEQKSLIADKVAALRSEAGLNTILDGIGEGFYAIDRDWRFILFNEEAARHFRCASEDILGRILWERPDGNTSPESARGRRFGLITG